MKSFGVIFRKSYCRQHFGEFPKISKNVLIEPVTPRHIFLLFHWEMNYDYQKEHPLTFSYTKEFITLGKIISITYEWKRQAITNIAFQLIAKLLLINSVTPI